jgi:two-component system response regulator ResD
VKKLQVNMANIRKKLGDKGDYIKTIWGMGYKFEVV